MKTAQIPASLKNRKQWLCWKWSERDGKRTKIPVDPQTNKATTAPEAAWPFGECTVAVAKRGLAGIGISLKEGLVGIDYDHVLDSDGEIKPEYARIAAEIDAVGSYTEVSPSGEGLHVLVQCNDIPADWTRVKDPDTYPELEFYHKDRYFTVTGERWKHSPAEEVATVPAETLRPIYARVSGAAKKTQQKDTEGGEKKNPEQVPSTCEPPRPQKTASESEVVYKLNRQAKTDAKLAGLWAGKWAELGYPSQSEADAALMVYLADLTDCNATLMTRVFLQSGLGKREKAQRPDYLQRTAESACKRVAPHPKEKKQTLPQVNEEEPDEETCQKARILANDPRKLEYLLDLFNRRHIGDREQAFLCLLCALAIRVSNAREGTDVVVSGERANGKTDFTNTIAKLIPRTLGGFPALITGEQSDRWITRAVSAGVLGNQCVMIFDDTFKSEQAALTGKQLTTWDVPHSYQALETDGKGYQPKIYPLPQRTVRIFANVDGIRDEQENSRILNLHISASAEREFAIRERIRQSWADTVSEEEIEADFAVVQCMWKMLPAEVRVTIPESITITGGEGDPRLYQRVYTLIASYAALRGTPEQTEIAASTEDARVVVAALNAYLAGKTGGGAEGMDAAPRNLLDALLARGVDWEGTQADLEKITQIGKAQVNRGLYGRKNTNGVYSQGLTQLGYIETEDITQTEVLDDAYTRRVRREKMLRFEYQSAYAKTYGIRFEVKTETGASSAPDCKSGESFQSFHEFPRVSTKFPLSTLGKGDV